MMIVRRWEIAAVAGTVALGACRKPPSPVVVMDKPEAVLDRTFHQVGNVIELSDGRVALTELSDKTFVFADMKTGETTPVGVHADSIPPNDPAPGKHKLPGYVVHLSGDTVALIDYAAARTTLWNEQGKYLGLLGHDGIGGHNLAINIDARGNSYKEDVRSVLGGLEPGQELAFDSMSVLRVPRGDTIADTVAKLRLPPWGRGQFGEQMKMVSTIFAVRDIFGVLPDGSMWIARGTNNAVDWRSPDGKLSRGSSRDFTRIPVTQEEKDAFLTKLRQQMSRMGAPAGVELSYPFAEEKAPFTSGVTNPAGQVWLERSRAFGDSVPVWDIVGRDGREIGAVQFPKASSVAGFGPDGRVYVILRDGDGGQKVGRFVVKEQASQAR
ncbi:MAG TPA: hypothetical protein VEI47_09085 [Gemmatimonadales bacterium]|nr:hypothetical protein [Gemmatimonadales bacterium]